jgi:hypothetical protein
MIEERNGVADGMRNGRGKRSIHSSAVLFSPSQIPCTMTWDVTRAARSKKPVINCLNLVKLNVRAY